MPKPKQVVNAATPWDCVLAARNVLQSKDTGNQTARTRALAFLETALEKHERAPGVDGTLAREAATKLIQAFNGGFTTRMRP